MICINHLSFRYDFQHPAVFTDLSLNIEQGKIIGLLGKNGTGKSTLLYLISGLLHDRKQSVSIDGTPSCLRRPETLSRIFFVPEEFELPSITMAQYVRLNRDFYPNFSDEILEQSLKDFELPTDINLGSLSMGQKKKAFISFALATQTEYLLLDEPTNGLDIPSKTQFRKVIAAQMNDDRTIIISTHQVHDVEMLIDHVIMLESDHLLLNSLMSDDLFVDALYNMAISTISEKLCFDVRPVGADLSDALYMEPSVLGTLVVARSDGFRNTTVNLELLFNAINKNPDIIARF